MVERATRSKRWINRPGRRSPHWWSATTGSSVAAGASASTRRAVTGRRRARSTANGSMTVSGREQRTRHSCSMARSVSVGASSALRTRCRESRTVRRTRRLRRLRRTGGLRAATWERDTAGRVWPPPRLPVRWISIAGAWWGTVEGYPGGRRRGARGLPLQWCSVDLREARVRPRPQDRQAPLGDDQGRGTRALADVERCTRPTPDRHQGPRLTSRVTAVSRGFLEIPAILD